jgi:hypothetical protein
MLDKASSWLVIGWSITTLIILISPKSYISAKGTNNKNTELR